MTWVSRAHPSPGRFTKQVDFGRLLSGPDLRKTAVNLKSFLFAMAIFCGGYVFSTILDEVVAAGEKYFHVQTSTYKIDSNGYIICSPEKPNITNADLRPLMLDASDK
jgi:hypothetical protein